MIKLIKISLFLLLFLFIHSEVFSKDPYFLKNKGRWDNNVLIYGKSPAYDIWITNGKIALDLYEYAKRDTDQTDLLRKGQVISLEFIGADFTDHKTFETHSRYYNYFRGNLKSLTNTPFSEIKYLNIYEGIDLILYFEDNFLRFDLDVHPGADPDDIKIKIDGNLDMLSINDNKLKIPIFKGEMNLQDIYAFQIENDEMKEVPLNIELKKDIIHFKADHYDQNETLRIDPLIYSSFIGGDNYDYGEDIKVDSEDHIYTCGYSYSSEYPTTTGCYSEEMTGEPEQFPDIVISKFNQEGDSLIFSTFIGGVIDDYGKSIALDTANNIYITGYCGPTSTFPTTTGAFDTTFNGGYDVFVIKLSPAGDSLLYSTFIGGNQDDYGQAITIDSAGIAFITGYTASSNDFPVSDNAFSKFHSGEYDVFVSKLSNDGKNLLYSTFLGGKDDDFGQDIEVDKDGKAYLTGITRSSDYPVSSRAYDRTYNDTTLSKDRGDCFLSKLDESGSMLEYSSYFGGKHTDGAYGVAIDSARNIYFAGISKSSDYPVTENSYQTEYDGNEAEAKGHGDIIITKLSPLGDSLIYSTYIGGESTDRAFDLALDKFHNALMTGSTASEKFPTTINAYDRTWNDSIAGSDAFIVKLNASGTDLLYSTYIGGRYKDVGNGLDHRNGMIYITGITASDNYPVTPGGFDTLYNGDNKYDIFVSKLYPYGMNFGDDLEREISLCQGDTVRIGATLDGYGIVTYKWSPATDLSDTTVAMPYAYPLSSTTYTIEAMDENGITAKDSVAISVRQNPKADIRGPIYVMISSTQVYLTEYEEKTGYTWSVESGSIIAGQNTEEITIQWGEEGDYLVRLSAINEYGCTAEDSLLVMVGEYFRPNIIVWGETEICDGDTVILDAGAGYSAYLWSDSTRTQQDTVTEAGDYWVVVADDLGFIGISDTISVTVYPLPMKPEIVYLNDMLRCYSFYPYYQWYEDGVPIPGAVDRGYVPTKPSKYFLVVSDDNGCSNVSNVIDMGAISVNDNPDDQYFSIIPNPNTGNFRIEINNDKSFISIEIINIFGQTVFTKEKISDERMMLHLEHIESGVYVIRAYTTEGIILQKFVKY
jgi:hypothetical protein